MEIILMKIKILLADDHKITRDGLRSLLEKQPDMEVAGEAGNGREAARLTRDLAPDVVVMDISMPDLNGIDAARQIKEMSPSTRIIALSMYSDREFIDGMLGAGASGYLAKDCAFDELVQSIHAVIDGKVYLSPSIADLVMKDYVDSLTTGAAPQLIRSAGNTLSSREREILQLIAEGHSTEQIAAKLFINNKTVYAHRSKIMEKLNATSIADLVKFAIKEGLTTIK